MKEAVIMTIHLLFSRHIFCNEVKYQDNNGEASRGRIKAIRISSINDGLRYCDLQYKVYNN